MGVVFPSQVAGENDARMVDVGRVVDPLVLKDVMRRVVNEYQQLAGDLVELAADEGAAVQVVVRNQVPGFVLAHWRPVEKGVDGVPEQKLADREEYDPARQIRPTPGYGFQTNHARQHEQTRDRSEIVQLECGEKVDAQGKQHQRSRHPQKAPFFETR